MDGARDFELLLEIYRDARSAEVAAFGWSPAVVDTFLRMQFRLQQRAYATGYPDAEHSVVTLDDCPMGQLRVHRSSGHMRLIDIGLRRTHWGRGIGSGLIRRLLSEAAQRGVPLHLSVRPDNPAFALYGRLGFQEIGRDPAHIALQWRPARALE